MCRVVRQRLCTCETGIRFHICLSESFSPDGSHATPKACRSRIAPTPLAGASLPDSFCSVCRSLTRPDGLESDSTERHWGLRLRARAFLASPWAKGSISVCLGSSATGGPALESGTSFTAHASAHDPKDPRKSVALKDTRAHVELPRHTENDSGQNRIARKNNSQKLETFPKWIGMRTNRKMRRAPMCT